MEAPSGSLRDVRRAERPGGGFHPALSVLHEAIAVYPADEFRSRPTSVPRAPAAAQEAFRFQSSVVDRLAHHRGRGADRAWDAYEIDLGGEA